MWLSVSEACAAGSSSERETPRNRYCDQRPALPASSKSPGAPVCAKAGAQMNAETSSVAANVSGLDMRTPSVVSPAEEAVARRRAPRQGRSPEPRCRSAQAVRRGKRREKGAGDHKKNGRSLGTGQKDYPWGGLPLRLSHIAPQYVLLQCKISAARALSRASRLAQYDSADDERSARPQRHLRVRIGPATDRQPRPRSAPLDRSGGLHRHRCGERPCQRLPEPVQRSIDDSRYGG